jgi:hypothetical protein
MTRSERAKAQWADPDTRARMVAGQRGNANGFKHGHGDNRRPSRTYVSWFCAKQRCFNPRQDGYHRYGERGITMCVEWQIL